MIQSFAGRRERGVGRPLPGMRLGFAVSPPFEPLDFIARLAALVPRPCVHLTRYHGVFAPHCRWRSQIAPAGRGKDTTAENRMPAERRRALSINRDEGLTKLLFDEATHRIIGAGLVGPNAGELIGEIAFAIEMGCEAEDIGLTIHPRPTLSETVGFTAEAYDGTLTDLYLPKK